MEKNFPSSLQPPERYMRGVEIKNLCQDKNQFFRIEKHHAGMNEKKAESIIRSQARGI